MTTDSQTVRVHRCAWCQNYMVDGRRVDSSNIDVNAIDSHGICLVCAYAVEAAYTSDDREM